MLADTRTGKNGRHALVGLLRQGVFGRLAGYEDVNDAERLCHDPAMRWIIGGKAAHGRAASPSQMGRFETRWLTVEKNLSALADLSGLWIDLVHGRRPPKGIVLDMDSSVSPTHGEQENSTWNGHYACTCYHPLFVFNQFGDKPRLRACGSEADRVGGSRCAGGRGRSAGPEQQIYEVVGRGRGRVRRFVARCHIDRGRSAGCRLRCRARGEIAHQANKHGHGDRSQRPDDEALRCITERGLPDHSIVGRATQPPREIAAGRKTHDLRHDQPDRSRNRQARCRRSGPVGGSERQPDPGAERHDDEGHGHSGESTGDGGAPRERRPARIGRSRNNDVTFDNGCIGHSKKSSARVLAGGCATLFT